MKRLTLFIFAAVTALLLTTACSFAAKTISLQNGSVQVTYPDGWIAFSKDTISPELAKELHKSQKDLRVYLSDNDITIAAQKEFNGQATELDLLYRIDRLSDKTTDFAGMDPLAYHAEYGKHIMNNNLNAKNLTLGPAKLYSSGNFPFVQLPVKVNNSTAQVYYTQKGGTIIMFLLTSQNNRFTDFQIADAQKIINSFRDTGYYQQFYKQMNTRNWGFLIPIVVLVAIGAALGVIARKRGFGLKRR